MYTQLNETLHLWGIDVIKLTPRNRSFRNSINLHSSSVFVSADCWLFSVRFFLVISFWQAFPCAITKLMISSAGSSIEDRGSRVAKKTFNFDPIHEYLEKIMFQALFLEFWKCLFFKILATKFKERGNLSDSRVHLSSSCGAGDRSSLTVIHSFVLAILAMFTRTSRDIIYHIPHAEFLYQRYSIGFPLQTASCALR